MRGYYIDQEAGRAKRKRGGGGLLLGLVVDGFRIVRFIYYCV